MWSVTDRKKIWKNHPLSHIAHCSFSNNGTKIVIKNTSGEIKIINSENGNEDDNFSSQTAGEGSNVIWVNNEYILDGSWSGFLVVRDVKKGNIVWLKHFKDEMIKKVFMNQSKTRFITQNQPKVNCEKRNEYGSYFISWELPFSDITGNQFEIPLDAIHDVSFCSNFNKCAVVHSRNPFKLTLYDMQSENILWSKETQNTGHGFCLSWSNDERVISVFNDNKIQFLKSDNGEIISEYVVPYACAIKYSKNNLAICSWENGRLISISETIKTF